VSPTSAEPFAPGTPGSADAPTSLPQFLYCWSAHGLFGTGYGVRAATADLAQLDRHEWDEYAAFCDYMPQEERQSPDYADRAPLVLARYRLPRGGFLIARKTPTGRPGTYFVHAILDTAGVADPLAIVDSYNAPFWRTDDDELGEGTHLLPAFDAAPWRAPDRAARPPEACEDLEGLLAAFVQAERSPGPLRLGGAGLDALRQVRTLLWFLPPSVAAALSFSTYESRERPGVLDVVAVEDARTQPPPVATGWVATLARLAREDPQELLALRDDERVRSMADLAAAVGARHEPVTPEAVRDAVEGGSPFLAELGRRPAFPELVVQAIDADPEWWRATGLARLPADVLGPPAELLALAAARHEAGDIGAASAFLRAYADAQPARPARLEDLWHVRDTAKPTTVTELASRLLDGPGELSEAERAEWEPLLICAWSRAAGVLRTTPAAWRPRLLGRIIEEGDDDASPPLGRDAWELVLDAVAVAARDPKLERRAADFLTGYASRQGDPTAVLEDALRRMPPPAFVREALAESLERSGIAVTPGLRRELLRAGTADLAAFQRLMVQTAAVRRPEPAPLSARDDARPADTRPPGSPSVPPPEPAAPPRRGLWWPRRS
jgi:hypothetical protein